MIKFIGTREGRSYLGLVITQGNVQHFKKGHPMMISAEDLGPEFREFKVQDILIMYYETEERALEDFKNNGFFGPKTIIHDWTKRRKQ
jgi:hypothetical protein